MSLRIVILLFAILIFIPSWADVDPPTPPRTFHLDSYEVTNRQMAAFLNEFGNPRIWNYPMISS